MNPYHYAIITALVLSVGQVLFKKAALYIQTLHNPTFLESYVLNIWFISAVVIYALSTYIWVQALTGAKLSMLYPIMSLGYVIVPVFAYIIFHETMSLYNMLGILLILIGVYVSVREW